MNYYERHIGDYLKDTAHLSLLEHGVYTRLMDVYYTREGAIPASEVARLIGARSRDEKAALQAVLAEFFVLVDGSYSQKRCDEELQAYRESQEGHEDKKLNDKDRQRRARERRKALFEQLRARGVVPPWDTKTTELQALLSRVTETKPETPVTQPVTRDNTATHTPDTSNQTPDTPHNPPEGGEAPPVKRKRSKAPEVTLAEWLAAEKAAGRKAIPADDAVFGYAQDIGLPAEFLHLAWRAFVAKYTAPPVKGTKQKTYVDWRAVFRLAVKEGWLKLWYLDGQHYALTTIGQQAQRELQAQPRQREEATA